jgi:hypothetical protein
MLDGKAELFSEIPIHKRFKPVSVFAAAKKVIKESSGGFNRSTQPLTFLPASQLDS